MPFPRLVPCLDCRDGRVVKGVRFRGLRDAGDPAALAARYAATGADEIVLLDVAATVAGRDHAAATVAAVRAVLPIPLTAGGGVRTIDDAARLLDAGADKVAVNSAALARPELLGELAGRFGAQCVVIAIDAIRAGDGGYEALSHAGGARTGRGAGYDLELVRAVAASVTAPVIASGGARGAADLAAAFAAGADAALLASALHDGASTVEGLKDQLLGLGVAVRR
jgi:cyclase